MFLNVEVRAVQHQSALEEESRLLAYFPNNDWLFFKAACCLWVYRLLLTHILHLCISQESRKSHTGSATSPWHHLHAVLRQSGGGRHLTNCLHLLQLLLAVFPGENRAINAAGHWPIIQDEEERKSPRRKWFRLFGDAGWTQRCSSSSWLTFHFEDLLRERWFEVASSWRNTQYVPPWLLHALSWHD